MIRRTEFDSGLRLVTERMAGVRSVTLGVWVPTGSRHETPRLAGASHFLEHLLFKGTTTKSAQAIADAFDAVGGDLNAFTGKETTCFYARVRDRDLPMAAEHLGDMLRNSVLRPEDFEAEREVVLEEIRMRDDTPEDLVHDLLAETVWPTHPLGRPVLGTHESIGAMTRDRVRRFYRSHYRPGRFVVAAAGNLRHEEVVRLVRRAFDPGRVRRKPTVVAPLPARRPPVSSGRTAVRNRTTEQAHLCLGGNGIGRNDPDRFAFGVLNNALGGGMSSRLFQEIREKRGLAYSVYSYHQMFAETGMFAVYAGTAPKKLNAVLELIQEQLDDLARHGIGHEELERAKGHMKGGLVLSLEDTSARMSRLGKTEVSGGEHSTVTQALKRISAVGHEDVVRVAERVLSAKMALAVLGPFERGAIDAERVAAHHGADG